MDDHKTNAEGYNHIPNIKWHYTFHAHMKTERVVQNLDRNGTMPLCVFDGIPHSLIPDGVQLVMSPVFAVDKDTGDVLVGDVSDDRMFVKKVYSRVVYPNAPDPDSFDEYGLPVYTVDQREEIIKIALADVTDGGLNYLYSVTVTDITGPEIVPNLANRRIYVRYAT